MTTVSTALADARERLADSPSARIDAEILLCHALGRERTWLHAWPEAALDPARLERFGELVTRRARGEPIAYIVGHRAFHALEVMVTPDVLIPRPETELLVEIALQTLATRDPGARVLDLGTGSGCVALAIAHAAPDAQVTAIDQSPAALAVARGNAQRLGLERIDFRSGDWLSGLGGRRFDVVVANPPYIAALDPHLDQGDVRFEPRAALVGGADGLDAIREIAANVSEHLAPDGLVAVEHGHDQGARVRELFTAEGLADVETVHDLAGHPRVTRARASTPHPPGWPGSGARLWRS